MPKGCRIKKTIHASEQARPDVARRREQWRRYQGRIDPTRLVFIDETWTKTNMSPLRGWAQKGQRLLGRAPYGHWNTMTFLAALRHDRIDAPFLLDGPINKVSFVAYIEQVLGPTLRPGDLVVADNLGCHESREVRAAPTRGGRASDAATEILARPESNRAGVTPRDWQNSTVGRLSF